VSNGSFFHHFPTKDHLVSALFLDALTDYHHALEAAIAPHPSASDGVAALVHAHLSWVEHSAGGARVLFEYAPDDDAVVLRAEREAENQRFGATIGEWRDPLVAAGNLRDLSPRVFIAQVIGPAQIACRAWLGGRWPDPPTTYADDLAAMAVAAVVLAA
jgi:AcrR family transcriptional regulator